MHSTAINDHFSIGNYRFGYMRNAQRRIIEHSIWLCVLDKSVTGPRTTLTYIHQTFGNVFFIDRFFICAHCISRLIVKFACVHRYTPRQGYVFRSFRRIRWWWLLCRDMNLLFGLCNRRCSGLSFVIILKISLLDLFHLIYIILSDLFYNRHSLFIVCSKYTYSILSIYNIIQFYMFSFSHLDIILVFLKSIYV